MESHHFEFPPLPPDPLWSVPVHPVPGYRDGEFRVRATDADEAARRARSYMGLIPTGPATRIDADDGTR